MALRMYKKYLNPIAMVLGFIQIYKDKGLTRLGTDLNAITWAKIQARYIYIVYAIAAMILVGVVRGLKVFDDNIKTAITFGLYYVAGWQIAKFIDPPDELPTSMAGTGYSLDNNHSPAQSANDRTASGKVIDGERFNGIGT